MRALLAVFAASLFVTACEPPPEEPASAPEGSHSPALAVVGPVLGGVDLGSPVRLIGTEPFWGVDIDQNGLKFTGVDRVDRQAPPVAPVVEGSGAVWNARVGDGASLVVSLSVKACSDGMSDRVYPLEAEVRLGEETLRGCADNLAKIMSGES
jgi:uncharacterized membrane protein